MASNMVWYLSDCERVGQTSCLTGRLPPHDGLSSSKPRTPQNQETARQVELSATALLISSLGNGGRFSGSIAWSHRRFEILSRCGQFTHVHKGQSTSCVLTLLATPLTDWLCLTLLCTTGTFREQLQHEPCLERRDPCQLLRGTTPPREGLNKIILGSNSRNFQPRVVFSSSFAAHQSGAVIERVQEVHRAQ